MNPANNREGFLLAAAVPNNRVVRVSWLINGDLIQMVFCDAARILGEIIQEFSRLPVPVGVILPPGVLERVGQRIKAGDITD